MSGYDSEQYWQAVAGRAAEADGQFVYAVRTTGVYCRPSCKSRPPRRENVEFFALPAAAEAAGYRPCKRCQPRQTAMIDARLQLAQAVCDYITAHLEDAEAVALDALSEAFGYTPGHLQKTFKAALGLSPRDYVEAQRLARLKGALRDGEGVAEAVYAAGYGSSSGIYERAAGRLGMTPGQYRRRGAGLAIRAATAETPFGTMLLATTERGVCAVGLYDGHEAAEAALRAEFPAADIAQDDTLSSTIAGLVAHLQEGAPLPDVRFDIQATAFQWRVWEALQAIPRGETRTYAQIAAAIGHPTAARAVAAACAGNHAAVFIPCHRVVGSDGALRGYKWGVERKRRLLDAERNVSA